MIVKCMYYKKEFKNKPNGYEVAEIQNKISKTQIEIKELAEGLSHGATFKPALLMVENQATGLVNNYLL